MKNIKAIYANEPIRMKDYKYYQKFLQEGEMIPDVSPDGVAIIFGADFPYGYEFQLRVCNARTDEGGAYVDPVLFIVENGVGVEVAAGDVGDSLDTEYVLCYDDTEFHILLIPVEE